MSPFTTHQPGGRRARVNERLFFIKRSLTERNNSRTGGVGGGSAGLRRAPETPRSNAACTPPQNFTYAPEVNSLGPLFYVARELAVHTEVANGLVLRGGERDTLIS